MIDPAFIPVVDLLPHGPEMTLIDRLVAYAPHKSVTTICVHPGCVFFGGGAVPAWVGIEYMAQSVAAHVGFEGRLRGDPPVIGFLLGTREYRSTMTEFRDGSTLTISVEPVLVDANMAAFKCGIETDGAVVATAVVNTYQPSGATLEHMLADADGP